MLPKVMIDTASAPAPETLKSLAAKLDADALLVGYQSMAGGASATMTRLDLRKADGSTQRVILRQCGPANLAAEPDSARHEFLLLQALSRRGFAVPDTLRTAHGILEEAWPPENRNGARLLHGDLWPGNLLWQQGTLNAVVDWEDASFGDPLIDLAIARVDMSWSFGMEAVAAFTEHYQKEAGLDLAALPLWDLHATLRQAPHAGDYAQGWQELGRGDMTPETITKTHEQFADEALKTLHAG